MTAVLIGCAGQATTSPDLTEQALGATAAIVNVSVISMESDRVDAGRTVVVAGDRIVSILPAGVSPPSGATVIDGSGKFLVPGLIDMHIHIKAADAPTYVQHGVTSARNMWGFAALLGRPRLADDAIVYPGVSPALYSASPGLDGPQVQWPETRVVTSPADARAAVTEFADQRWRWLKAYTSLSAENYAAIGAAAAERGIRVIGHVPLSVSVHDALAMKQYSIEHLSGYERALTGTGNASAVAWANANMGNAASLAAETKAAGTWNCPTSVVLDAIAARNGADTRTRAATNRHAMIAALHSAGARLIAGTDAGIDITAPGSSLHDELGELVASGLTPYEAVRAATKDAAEFLAASMEIGTIVPGKRADLVLLDENPLRDIRNTRSIRGVMLRGRWFSR